MNQILASASATGRHCRLPSHGQLVALAMITLTSACYAPPLVPAKAPEAAPAAPPERRAPAIERSEPVVEPDSERSPRESPKEAPPSAAYLDAVHARLHPVFAKTLADFDSLPQAPARGGDLVTVLEVVLSPGEGRIERIGIIKSSGSTVFNVTTLDSFLRAQPFGKAPDFVVSSDGKVYLHWEVHRDGDDACSPRNAYPLMLRPAP